MSEQPKYLDVNDVAAILGVSAPTIYRLAKTELPSYQIGGSYKFVQAEIDAYLIQHRSIHSGHVCTFCFSVLKDINGKDFPTIDMHCPQCGHFKITAEAQSSICLYDRTLVIRTLPKIRKRIREESLPRFDKDDIDKIFGDQ